MSVVRAKHASLIGCGLAFLLVLVAPRLTADPDGIFFGRITKVSEGPALPEGRTIIIVADKGAQNGVSRRTISVVKIHQIAVEELQVLSVSGISSQLRGYYYDSIRSGDRIVFNNSGHPLDTREALRYFQ